MDKKALEEGKDFTPCFDKDGLIPCITQCHESGDVVMFAFMNKESLGRTIETGEAHYWSRSRQELWHKGATSGFIQRVMEMRTDCDQDCLLITVHIQKPKSNVKSEGTCHTGRETCFYRKIPFGKNNIGNDMIFIDE